MIEIQERRKVKSRAETYPCRICKEMVRELFLCDSCCAKICGDCFIPHEEQSEDGFCVFCDENANAISN